MSDKGFKVKARSNDVSRSKGAYRLPEDLRSVLAKPHIYFKSVHSITGAREYTACVLRAFFLTRLYETAVVGDLACRSFLSGVGVPRLCVIDGKSERMPLGSTEELKGYFDSVERCSNPPAHITDECVEALSDKLLPLGVRTLLVVDGEEDLLVLPLALLMKRGFVVFGLPFTGVAFIDVEEARVELVNVLSMFRRIASFEVQPS